jgi:hypothetical protein
MNTEISNYINEQFKSAPKTKKALELKEELIANAQEKLADMIAGGHNEQDSIAVVINSIGNVRELFPDLLDGDNNPTGYDREDLAMRKKFAIIKAISASLFALATVIFLTLSFIEESYFFDFTESGVTLLLLGKLAAGLMCIVAVGMLTYANHMMPQYRRKQDDIVEEYKEWKSQSARRKAVRGSISMIIWLTATILFFLISFATMAWHITWILFLAAACAEAIATLLYNIKE